MTQRSDRTKSLAAYSRFHIGAVLVQPDRLVVAVDGREIALEPRVFEVLIALAEHAGEVVSPDQLLIEVWHGTFYGDNPVHKAIAQIRRVIGDDIRAPRYIETIRKRGYRLIAEVKYPDRYRRALAPDVTWPGRSPFVGLAAFDEAHSGVFFGRGRATAGLLAAMRSQLDNQRRLVLIAGASGCGKTSLLHAGAVPLLRQDGGFNGLHALSLATADLAAAPSGDVLAVLASALDRWTAGGHALFQPALTAARLAQLLERPGLLGAAVAAALGAAGDANFGVRPHAHLLLLIDHAESLVTSRQIQDVDRQRIALALGELCDCAHVLVVLITRSDLYPRLIETLPVIAELKGSDGHVDVLAPRAGEIAQIIRLPALLAGLSFEEDAQNLCRLDDVLRDAALEHPDALPLLQHALQALYERRSDAGVLTFAGYREIGGLVGALAHRAEEVFSALPLPARTSLGAVFAQLIVVQADSDIVSARRVRRSALADEPADALVEAFVRARLFVGELSDGQPEFGVAHEALLRQWPRAREWIQDNRRLLQARARLRRAALRWVDDGRRSDHLLNPGQPLTEAAEVAQHLADDLGAHERELLAASQRQYRQRRARRIVAIAALALLAGVSSVMAVLAQQARREAEQRREEALQLSDFLLVDLAEKLRPLGNLKLLDSISAAALSQLERRSPAQLRTEDLINRSRALRTAGEVMMEQAKFDEARSALERAVAAAGAAVAREPGSVDALAESGIAAYWLGYYAYRQRRLDEAHASWLSYRDSSERLMALEPDNLAWQVELSYALNNLGTLASDQQRMREAVAHFQRSAGLKRRVLERRPDDGSLRYDLVDTLSWISSADESSGNLQAAAAGYAEQIAALRALVGAKPEAHAWQRRLAISLLRSARLSLTRGDLQAAQALIDESVARLATLTREEAENHVWKRDLAHAHLVAAEIQHFRGRSAPALAHADAALALSRQLMTDTQPLREWQVLDAVIRQRAAVARAPGADAEHALDRAVDDLRGLVAQEPQDITGRAKRSRIGARPSPRSNTSPPMPAIRACWCRGSTHTCCSARRSGYRRRWRVPPRSAAGIRCWFRRGRRW